MYQRRKRIKDPVAAMLKGAEVRAKKNGIPFNLKKSDIEIPEVCPILGIPLFVSGGCVSQSSPSLDKKIPKLGYVKGNVAVISHLANAMKNSATPEQLRMFVANIGNYMEEI